MVAFTFFANIRSLAGIAVAAVSMIGATPAMAASANADVIAPLRAAQAAKVQPTGDAEFRALFASWQSLDKGANLAASTLPRTDPLQIPGLVGSIIKPTTVSIPSRNPVEGLHLTSDFGMRVHPILGVRKGHKGIDLAGPVGTPIHAPADGVVSRANWFSSYGLYVSLEHGGNIETRFGHMSRLNVAAGQMVKKGDVIGYIGSTGRSTGPHLHYEVRVAGAAVNPIPYMQSVEDRPVLAMATAMPAIGGQ